MAPSPSVLFPPAPAPPPPDGDRDRSCRQPRDDHDLSLDYISRMLMEEDIVDKFLLQYPDHAALLQAQHPFSQILSTSSGGEPGMLATGLLHRQNPAFFSKGMEPSNSSMDMLSSMAFFKGMEEANSFLPTQNGVPHGGWRNDRSRGNGGTPGGDAGRSSKPPESDEEATVDEMLDQLMLHGHDMCPIEERGNEAEQQQQSIVSGKAPRRRRAVRNVAVVDLETLLIRCADAVATNDRRGARELLGSIKRHSSPTGDATQRLAHYFAEGLEARLAGRGSQLYLSLMAKRTSLVERLQAYKLLMSACCFVKVAFLFANKSIFNAVSGKRKLHIVHYGISDGFQWPELLRWLVDREGGPPEVRITSITCPRPGFRPSEQIEDAGHWLSQCASRFGVPFKFRAMAAKSEDVRVEDLDIHPDEVLVVNSLLHFRSLMDESVIIDRPNPRDMVLATIRKMKPAVFVHAIVNASYNRTFFMTRFRQVLYNLAAHFDMMEATVPRDNGKRLLVERDIFARCAMNIIACEGTDRVERPQNYREWQARNQRAGLRQLPLDPDIVLMLKGRVKKQYHKHFVINEDQQWLLQGWKGRVLYALSTWVADDATNSEVT